MSGENLDRSADLVVVGSGAAGFAAAITGRRAGLDVLLLERCRELGGTTARSGTWIWVPNNRLMRDAGLDDPRDAALRYMARLARPGSVSVETIPCWACRSTSTRCWPRSTTMPRMPSMSSLRLVRSTR